MIVAYLTGEYPRATDTFIQREVAALRALGLTIETCSIRRTRSEHHVGPEQRMEAAQTFYTLAAARNPLRLLSAHLGALLGTPLRYVSALALALRLSSGGLKAGLYQLIYFAEAVVLARHLRRIGAQHIHNHIATGAGSVAMLAADLVGIPFSFTLHGPGIFFEPHRWRLDEKIARARFVACISNFAKSQAMLFSKPADWAKLKIVHCGIEPERYVDAPARRGRRLVFVGRLAAVKGLDLLVEAFAQVHERFPEAELVIAGDGPDRRALEAKTREANLGEAVLFTGYLSQDEVAGLLTEADIFVLPSFAEGVPVVLMEAMASGIPVVATQVGGVGELVKDGVTGRLVAPGDAGLLADAVNALLADPDQCARMGEAGRDIVRREFASRSEAAKLAALLRGEDP